MDFKIALRALASEVKSIRATSGVRRCRLPRSIWEKAGALARIHGVEAVAKAANLSPKPIIGYLNKHGRSKPSSFVEVAIPGTGSVIGHCRVRIEALNGRRMEIRLPGVDCAALGGIVREFLS